MNLIYTSLGMPTVELDENGRPAATSVDERNEELYDRDDHRQFHVPVTQVRNDFYTVMAKNAADAEAVVHARMRGDRTSDEALGRLHIGPAIEA